MELNWYFIIAVGLLTLNAFLYTQSVIKEKEDGWKAMLFGGVTAYLCFFVLMYKMSNFNQLRGVSMGKIVNRGRTDTKKGLVKKKPVTTKEVK